MKKKGILAACGIGVVLAVTSVPVMATIINVDVGRVVRVREYVTFGDGDVAVWTQNGSSGCDGFWFRTTEKNGKEIFAHLLFARATSQAMTFTVYDDQLWSGTGSHFCKIYSAGET